MVGNYRATEESDTASGSVSENASASATTDTSRRDRRRPDGGHEQQSMNHRSKIRSSRSRLLSDASSPVDLPVQPIGLQSLADSALVDDADEHDDQADGDDPFDASSAFFGAQAASIHESTSDDSIYPEVRAAVPPTDNQHLSVDTPRMWALSLLFAVLGSSTNLFFSLRYPSVAITPVVALLLVHPLGRGWDLLLKRAGDPEQTYSHGSRIHDAPTSPLSREPAGRLASIRRWLAQGKWNEKEHACVYISSNVSFGFAFATDVIVEQHKFYKQDVPFLYQVCLTLSSQILGYAFAGITRRYLVRPPSMIWPGILASAAMFTTLHKRDNKPADGWRMSRLRFFVYVWVGGFAWYFLPGLLMPALGAFNVLTWFAPDNTVLANLFGVRSGLGLFPLTFDWAYIAYIGSPLLTPWWAAANVLAGVFVVMWILAPIFYYTNVLSTAYLPILSSNVFDNRSKVYDVTKILTKSFRFDLDAYKRYSPIYLPVTYVLSYALQFAGLAALISHTCCWHGADILQQTKDSISGDAKQEASYHAVSQDGDQSPTFLRRGSVLSSPTLSVKERRSLTSFDVHNRLMDSYPDAPILWYLMCFIGMLILATLTVEIYPTGLPWYGLLFALLITAIMFLPTAIVMAVTNQHISISLMSQIICGLIFPGRPVANMVFVLYCYISSAQGIKFASDLKLGHYMKLPPRLLFKVQVAATLVSGMTQIGVLNWMFTNMKDLCHIDATNGFSCPIARVHFNGSILWGVVGPARFFGPGALYRHLIWAFPVGFVAPLVVWHLSRRHRNIQVLSYINFPLMFSTLSWMPPATGLNFSIWALVCFVFNKLLRARAFNWWSKYTLTLSAALDFGLACGVIIVFFVFVYPGWMDNFSWWGTEIYKQGCDWKECSYLEVPPGQQFGG